MWNIRTFVDRFKQLQNSDRPKIIRTEVTMEPGNDVDKVLLELVSHVEPPGAFTIEDIKTGHFESAYDLTLTGVGASSPVIVPKEDVLYFLKYVLPYMTFRIGTVPPSAGIEYKVDF